MRSPGEFLSGKLLKVNIPADFQQNTRRSSGGCRVLLKTLEGGGGGKGCYKKIHSVGEVWIFSRSTHFNDNLLPGIEKPSLQIPHSPSSCLETHSWLCHNHSHIGCTSERD